MNCCTKMWANVQSHQLDRTYSRLEEDCESRTYVGYYYQLGGPRTLAVGSLVGFPFPPRPPPTIFPVISMSETAPSTATVTAKKILIVDDDYEIIDSIRYALEGQGYLVVIARDGNQALALAERDNPDLMILDMMMPKRSGFLVLEKLRRVRETPLPVIMITGNEGSRHKAYAELLGVSDYIRKPFAMDRLLQAVEKLLPA